MSSPERPSQPEPVDIRAALGAIGIGMGPLTASRRIIRPRAEGRVVEFYSSLVGGRVMAMPAEREAISAEPSDSIRHRQLQDGGLPVFETVELAEGFTFLRVPLGTYPLRSRLALAAKNLPRYGGLLSVLTEVAATQQRQHDAHLGVMTGAGTEVPLLDRVAVVDDNESPNGLKPYLIPPYEVQDGTPQNFASELAAEIAGTGLFDQSAMETVRDLIQRGIRQEGAPGEPAS